MTERLIAIDVGAGTADIVVRQCDEPPESSVKLVVPSQTQVVAARIAAATRAGAAVLFAGPTMGGGADTRAMKAHTAAGLPFLATEAAAHSFADDLDRVRARGVRIVADDEARALAARAVPTGSRAGCADGSSGGRGGQSGAGRDLVVVRAGDVDAAALLDALRRLGVDTRCDGVAVAVQDHGFCPGSSNRVFRFSLWERAVLERRTLRELFYWADDDAQAASDIQRRGDLPAVGEAAPAGDIQRRGIPAALTRMRAAAACAAELLANDLPPTAGSRVLAGDTGPAALLGALTDPAPPAWAGAAAASAAKEPDAATVLVNVGNGHTIAAVARGGRLAGVYEHHTGLLDGVKLERQLRRFLAGDLTAAEVRADGGHGAVLDEPVPIGAPLLVTGPNRGLLRHTHLPVHHPAPWGDMMIAGAVGLLEAFGPRQH